MTPNEAREAIAGDRRVSVFFTDEVLAVRMQLNPGGAVESGSWLLPSEPGKTWKLVGEAQYVRRGTYDIPMFAGKQQVYVVMALSRLAHVNYPRGLGILRGIVIEREGVRYLIHERADIYSEPVPACAFPASATLDVVREEPKKMRDNALSPAPPLSATPSPAPAEAQTACARSRKKSDNWKMLVQMQAREYWLVLRAAGANPTVSSILDRMARWCSENDVKTSSGIYPTPGYLRTHVLGGKHWTQPSDSVQQAKRHVAQAAQIAQEDVAQPAQ